MQVKPILSDSLNYFLFILSLISFDEKTKMKEKIYMYSKKEKEMIQVEPISLKSLNYFLFIPYHF